MNKKNSTSFIALGLCILCVVAAYFIFSSSSKISLPEKQTSETFADDNWNLMNTDTFMNLINKQYGASAKVTKHATEIKVSISGANMKTQDFFNGNNRLLDFKLSDYGFEINYLKNSNQINATFNRKAGGVIVPNDVLINLAK